MGYDPPTRVLAERPGLGLGRYEVFLANREQSRGQIQREHLFQLLILTTPFSGPVLLFKIPMIIISPLPVIAAFPLALLLLLLRKTASCDPRMQTEKRTVFKIGSRQSQLALIQSRQIKKQLKALYPDLTFKIVPISTKGDQILDVALSKIGTMSFVGVPYYSLHTYLFNRR